MGILILKFSKVGSVDWWHVVTNVNVSVFWLLTEGIVIWMRRHSWPFSNGSEHVWISSNTINPLISSSCGIVSHSHFRIVLGHCFWRFSVGRLKWIEHHLLYLKRRKSFLLETCSLKMLSFFHARWIISRSKAPICCLWRDHVPNLDRVVNIYFLSIFINGCSHFIL